MFCANCGTKNDDDVVYCSNCGKSPKGDTFASNQQSTFPLTNFTARAFKIWFEIILWINLVGGIIGGGIAGKQIGELIQKDLTFLGIIIGGIYSFVFIIFLGGLVSLLIKLVNNSEEIKKKNNENSNLLK